jgi:hypothetical protein
VRERTSSISLSVNRVMFHPGEIGLTRNGKTAAGQKCKSCRIRPSRVRRTAMKIESAIHLQGSSWSSLQSDVSSSPPLHSSTPVDCVQPQGLSTSIVAGNN